ncbi:hypothetical protein [Hymenobacter rubripertinctus]|uniref:hypothetical protein n=1 Tax=Hymenobacter rubripertinctus TaxID=2029981 RepID=UPI0011C3FCB4|nr:hypothetical protein [Hymenobacter rubripertinctus]
MQQWSSPTGGTPDYYATNATDPMVVPATAVYGPFTPIGTGSIGLFARRAYSTFDPVSEYVSAPISLGSGHYYAQLRVNITSNTNAANQGIASGFGIQFSTGQLPDANVQMRSYLRPNNSGVLSSNLIGQAYVNNWSQAPISGQFDLPSGATVATIGLFNDSPTALTPLPNRNSAILNTYFFVDDVQIFRVPTAGPNIPCVGSAGVSIGEGCLIPGATYRWLSSINSGPFSGSYPSTLNITVSPSATTTYQLTVTLPDGSTYVTSTVVGTAPPMPTIQDPTDLDGCDILGGVFTITNYNPQYTYTVSAGGSIRLFPGLNTTYGTISVKANGKSGEGYITVVASA